MSRVAAAPLPTIVLVTKEEVFQLLDAADSGGLVGAVETAALVRPIAEMPGRLDLEPDAVFNALNEAVASGRNREFARERVAEVPNAAEAH
jgi:hypothetical protein